MEKRRTEVSKVLDAQQIAPMLTRSAKFKHLSEVQNMVFNNPLVIAFISTRV